MTTNPNYSPTYSYHADTRFVSTLPIVLQSDFETRVTLALAVEGLTGTDLVDGVQGALDSRVCDIAELLETAPILTVGQAATALLATYPTLSFERDEDGEIDTTLYDDSVAALGLTMPAPIDGDYSPEQNYIHAVVMCAADLADAR